MQVIRTLLFLMILSTAIKANAQDLACKDFRNGTFKSTNEGLSIIIKREGNLQEEYLDGSKTPAMSFSIKWIDDCTYTLAFDTKVLEKNKAIPKDALLTVKITKTTADSYTYSCSSNFSDLVITGLITKIK